MLSRRHGPVHPTRTLLCSLCQGARTTPCATCRGAGYVKRGTWIPRRTLDADSELCPTCVGTARSQCPRCRGDGHEP
jgi:DnaJ-class molecular chaperone